MPRVYKPADPNWTKKQLECALEESETKGTSTRALEQKYNIPRATLNRYIGKMFPNIS